MVTILAATIGLGFPSTVQKNEVGKIFIGVSRDFTAGKQDFACGVEHHITVSTLLLREQVTIYSRNAHYHFNKKDAAYRDSERTPCSANAVWDWNSGAS